MSIYWDGRVHWVGVGGRLYLDGVGGRLYLDGVGSRVIVAVFALQLKSPSNPEGSHFGSYRRVNKYAHILHFIHKNYIPFEEKRGLEPLTPAPPSHGPSTTANRQRCV